MTIRPRGAAGASGELLTRLISVKVKGTIWGPVPQAILTYIRTLGGSLGALVLEEDDIEAPQAPDGVRATEIVPYTLIPGLHRFDGYTALRKRLHKEFALVDGEPLGGGPPANYFEFAYDWRRDNRASARALKDLIDRELPRWQERYPNAKAILLAHSMGGLVSRWYLEKLGGHDHVKALITSATPHRGSPNALDFIANGHRKLWLDFTTALRSLESVYQLLPIYPSIRDEHGRWHRAAEIDIPTKNPSKGGAFDRSRAAAALRFHRDIEAANASHGLDDAGIADLLPIQGWGQSTKQSGRIEGKRLKIGEELPPDVEEIYAGGDGTVPTVSAIPLELDGKPTRCWPFNQRHGTIQDASVLLGNVVQFLRKYQGLGKHPARAPAERLFQGGASFDVDDLYLLDEPITVSARFPADGDPGNATAEVRPWSADDMEPQPPVRQIPLVPEGDVWVGSSDSLPAGTYRMELRLSKRLPGTDDPLVDIFEVG